MDITSFSLGISFVVVVGMLTVTVYNLFRVYKMNKEIEGINQSANANNEFVFRKIEENKTIATMENEALWREFRDLNSKTDSRLDKLIYRIERLERERLGKTRQEDELEAQKLKFMRKELLKDGI
jgi:hypothetical protein